MKNTLMVLLIATMGMLTTNSNAEIEAHNCVEFVKGKYGEIAYHNLCDRKIYVRYCYEDVPVSDYFHCGEGKNGSYYQGISPTSAYGKGFFLSPTTRGTGSGSDHEPRYAVCFGLLIDDSSGDGRYSCR